MNADFTRNHFELLGLPVGYQLETDILEQAWLTLQREVHPDRFANATDAEKRLAAQWATRANEAYQTLKSPLARGRYLLKLNGIDTEEESNTSMPIDFLLSQMERRGAVADARRALDEDRLDEISGAHRADEADLFVLLALQLATLNGMASARLTVRKLRFLEKLGEEIDLAFESISG